MSFDKLLLILAAAIHINIKMGKNNFNNRTLGEIVTDDFRTAGIFQNAGLDFCCGGKKLLEHACREKNISFEEIVRKLEDVKSAPQSPGQNFNEWKPDFLADYIVNIHHSFVRKNLPELDFYTKKIADVHGDRHPELIEVAGLFGRISSELKQHLQAEEEVLFPAIREAMKGNSPKVRETISSEIARMSGEHDFVGGAMDKINEITNGYKVPADGCNTYMVAFRLLNQFEDDLHIHVHLENNILFPRALTL